MRVRVKGWETGEKKREREFELCMKEYVAEITLGATTPSFDLETEIDAIYPYGHVTRELVEQTAAPLHREGDAGASGILGRKD